MGKKKKEAEEEGMSLDDAFGDDEDVEYAESKPRKLINKKKEKVIKEKVREKDSDDEGVKIKGSKPISELKKGDKIKVDGLNLEVDAHYVLIDHGSTKEMALDVFDPKKDKDYELRYFSDNVENSIEFFELVEILYSRIEVRKIEW